MYIINLTALGITATKEQLDFWYSVWQQNHKLGMRVHRASGNDIPLAVLNNQSLNQVFNSNLVVNGDFSNGTTNWATAFASRQTTNVSDNTLKVTSTLTSFNGTSADVIGWYQNILINGTNYYLRVDVKTNLNSDIYLGNNPVNYNLTPNLFQSISKIYTGDSSGFLRLYMLSTFTNHYVEFDNAYAINLTSLGIATLTKSQLDYLFTVWQFNTLNALVARQFIQEA
jgi:hypothetical protein